MKLPLPTTLRNRRGNTTRDARILNGFVDRRGRIDKRPSINASFDAVEPGPGLGLFVKSTPNPNGGVSQEVIAISDDVLTTNPTSKAVALRFHVQPPASVNLNSSFSPSVVVRAVDRFGAVKTSFTSNVTLSLSSNPAGATLSGTTTVAAVAGVATFSDLKIDKSGADFRLEATASGLRSATSNAFSLPTQLVFTTQPANTGPGDTMADVVVAARDSAGTTDTSYSADVSLSLYAGASVGVLDGITTRLASNGVATFSGLSIDEEGTYTLRATANQDSSGDAYTPSAKVSNSFDIVDSTHTLVAGDAAGNTFGYSVPLAIGSLTPDTLNGETIDIFVSDIPDGTTTLRVVGVVAQNLFTSVTINGVTLNSGDATFSTGTNSVWTWTPDVFSATGTYPVTFV